MAKGHGGKRKGAGRKPKVEEVKLVERLTPLTPLAYKALENGLKDDKNWAVKLWFEYMHGKPKETVNLNTFVEQPLFPD